MEFDSINENLCLEYDLFLASIKNEYLNYVAPGKTVTVAEIAQMKKNHQKAIESFLGRFDAVTLAQLLAKAENLPKSDLDTLTGIVTATRNDVSIMLSRNVAVVAKMLRESTGMLAASLGDDSSAVGKLISKRLSEVKFEMTDSANRKWDSAKLFAFYTRNMFYSLMINSDIMQAKREGHDLMEVYYDDVTHKNYGVVFSITGETPNVPTLKSLERSVFHYNAKAEVRPYVYPEE